MRFSWWTWLPFWRWRVIGETDYAGDVPERLPRNGVVLIGEDRLKWIVFDCPCRRGHRIMLNADSARHPYWTLKSGGTITISPSIDYVGGNRRCHYFVHDGRIEWVGDSL